MELKRKLFRWWRQGRGPEVLHYGSTEDESLIVEFPEVAIKLMIAKEKGEDPHSALRRYLMEFKDWAAIEDEHVTIDEVDLGHAWAEIVTELEWYARCTYVWLTSLKYRQPLAASGNDWPEAE